MVLSSCSSVRLLLEFLIIYQMCKIMRLPLIPPSMPSRSFSYPTTLLPLWFFIKLTPVMTITIIIQLPMQNHELLMVPLPRMHLDPNLPARKQIDTRWVQIKFSNSFTPRSYFASCIQAGTIYLHGGFSAETGILKDFYTSNLYELPASWKTITPKNSKSITPGTLRNHTLNSYLSNLILIGGQRNVVENNKDIYRFDLLTNSWSICKCIDEKGKKLNLALDSHSSVVYKNHLYIFHGYDAISTNYITDIIKISLERLGEDQLTYEIIKVSGDAPAPRGNSSVCLVGNTVFIFGGGCVDDAYGDLWMWEIQSGKWTELPKSQETIAWPDKRKGGTLVHHQKSNTLFLFGGIKKITKQQNDVMVYIIDKRRWIKIHSSTNQLYDPSPTLKDLTQSPTILEQKRRRQKVKSQTSGTFKLGMRSVNQSDSKNRLNETNIEFIKRDYSTNQHNTTQISNRDFKRKISVVQQKKYREFLNRKKKLLSNIESGAKDFTANQRRSHSPTSEALIFSLNCMGEQPRNQKSQMNLPKVIFDEGKGYVIGKKPCARDGHAALLYEECMIILGGDRHMVSFNDAYMFKLNKGVESLPHYA